MTIIGNYKPTPDHTEPTDYFEDDYPEDDIIEDFVDKFKIGNMVIDNNEECAPRTGDPNRYAPGGLSENFNDFICVINGSFV